MTQLGRKQIGVDAERLRVLLGSQTLPAGTVDHGGLIGLGDDDHTQYLLADGTRALTAAWDAGDWQIRALTFYADVATGTPPLVVVSTTLVGNLNADLLDGYHAADLALVGHTHAHSALTGVTADQHHAQVHALAGTGGLGADHTVTGLTAGQVLRATGATTAAFQSLVAGDLPTHPIITAHSIVASQYQLVGATEVNTLGLLTPSSNPGAAVAILASAADGGVQLLRLGIGADPATDNQITLVNNGSIGLGSTAGQIYFSSTPTPDEVHIRYADLVFMTDVGVDVLWLRRSGNVDTLEADIYFHAQGGVAADSNFGIFIDAANDGAADYFAIFKDAENFTDAAEILRVTEAGVMTFRNAAVAHGGTDIMATDIFAYLGRAEDAAGGLLIRALKDTDATNAYALVLAGGLAENADTTKSTTGHGIVEIRALQVSGTTWGNTVADGNLLSLATLRGGVLTTVGIWDEDGDYYYNGALTAYDDEDDALAVHDLAQGLAGNWERTLEYGCDALARMGVIAIGPDGGTMVSHKRMTALLMGAIGQLYQRLLILEGTNG